MQLLVERSVLWAGLQKIQGVVEKRNTMPILSNLLLEGEGENMRIFATDLEIGLRAEYPAKIEKPGGVSLSARKLFDIVRELPDIPIKITAKENHWVEISAAKSKFRMAGLPPEEFPPVPSPEKEILLSIGRKPFLEGIEKVVFAVGNNDTRHILNGVLLNVKPEVGGGLKLCLVGTDGHRLAKVERKIESAGEKGDAIQEHSLVISKKAILEIKKILEEDEEEPVMCISENQLVLKKSSLFFITRLLEGAYPNYDQVIPKNNHKKVTISRIALEGALKRVSIFAREKTNAVRLTLQPKQMRFLSTNPDVGEAEEEIQTDYQGEVLETSFNARYILDALSVMKSENILMHFSDSTSPCLVTDPADSQFICVVMPMRV